MGFAWGQLSADNPTYFGLLGVSIFKVQKSSYIKAFPQGLVLAGEHNSVLNGLGITAVQSTAYANALKSYLASPSFETAATSYNLLGIIEDGRVEKYIQEYRHLADNPLLLWALMRGVSAARLEDRAVSLIRDWR